MKKRIIGFFVMFFCLFLGLGAYHVNAKNDKSKYENNGQYQKCLKTNMKDLKLYLNKQISDLEYMEALSSDGVTDTYVDDQNNLYNVVEEKKIVGFVKIENDNDMQYNIEMDEEAVKWFADKYLKVIVGNRNKKYKLSDLYYDEYSETYHVVYYSYIGEYKTTDVVYFDIANNGEVMDFGMPFLSLYDNVEIEYYERDMIKEKADLLLRVTNPDCTDVVLGDIIIEMVDASVKYRVCLFYKDLETGAIFDKIIYIDAQ